ncbi:hypothetical protein ACET3Z_016146 [Daucus carota]
MDQKHKPTEPRTVCCIGDIHGHITKLQSLCSNLQAQIGPSDFNSALIIFLGDYCDRGNNTSQVLDFLISLPSKYPQQTHVFLSGNHDLAFAGFVGALPAPAGGAHFSDTWSEYEANEEREGWYKDLEYERMHVQSRRWAGKMSGLGPVSKSEYKGSIYDAGPTFESYGFHMDHLILSRQFLLSTRSFWLIWFGSMKRIIIPKVEALSGRKNVWDLPEDLAKSSTIVVSGHHGKLHIEGHRLIIDEGGGLEHNPVAAVVLPSMTIVRDTDQPKN